MSRYECVLASLQRRSPCTQPPRPDVVHMHVQYLSMHAMHTHYVPTRTVPPSHVQTAPESPHKPMLTPWTHNSAIPKIELAEAPICAGSVWAHKTILALTSHIQAVPVPRAMPVGRRVAYAWAIGNILVSAQIRVRGHGY